MAPSVLLLSAIVAAIIGVIVWWSFKSIFAGIAAFGVLLVMAVLAIPPAERPLAENERIGSSNSESRSHSDGPTTSVKPRRSSDSQISSNTPPANQTTLTSEQLESYRPIEVKTHGYRGAEACKECHSENHASWFASYHRTMTQVADPSIVLGDFDNVSVTHKGREYLMTKQGDTCMINMPTEDGKQRVTAPIVMTTGSHHMQVYWFATGRERLTGMLPLIHLNESNEWIPRDSAFLVQAHSTPSFETGRWNETCSACHSTHRKGRRLASGNWDTHVGEFGISCEACHGPGEQHIAFHRQANTKIRPVSTAKSDPIVNPIDLSKVLSSQVCGQCHAVLDPLHPDLDYQENGHKYRPGKDLTETHGVWNRDTPEYESTRQTLNYPDLDTLLNETYYPDGMIRVSGREYNGLIESPCYIKGEMTCFSCHQLHKTDSDTRSLKEWANDQLHPEALGDQACLQCHQAQNYATTMHTHHAVGSTGASCYNCHMPHTAYGLLKAIRNHQVSSPDIGKDHAATRPNACNMCHLDKTLQWSADHLKKWYQIEPPELGDDEKNVAASLIWLLKGNAAERAISAWSMGWKDAQAVSGTDWQVPFLISLLDDEYDAIRLIARRTLKTLPGYEDFQLDVVTSTSSQQRQKSAMRVFETWLKQTDATRKDRPALLIDEKIGFKVPEVKRLLEQRDNTPMLLSE